MRPFVRKRKDKIVVGCTNVYYSGNPRAVFEFLQQNPDRFECFWVAHNWISLREVRRTGGNAHFKYSILALPKFLRTDVWVVAHLGTRHIDLLPDRRKRIVMTWHGIGPKGINLENTYERFDCWCVSSEFSRRRHIELWNAPPEKLRVTGFARIDRLIDYLGEDRERLLNDLGIASGKTIVLYAPTAETGLWPWDDPLEGIRRLCGFCEERDLVLLLRLHFASQLNEKMMRRILGDFPQAHFMSMTDVPDTEKVLAVSDVLITDWSSIYTDYLFTRRPIVFMEVKRDFFTEKRGKSEVPPEWRPGEIAYSEEELYERLDLVLKEGNRHEKEQEWVFRIIHGVADGRASERVVKVIEELACR